MTADNFTEAARIIDAHRENERWVGDGVKIECVCGHTSHATYDFSGPITEDKNNHRDAERMHAAHVAQVLAAQEPTDAEQAVRWLHREREWRPLDGTFIGGTVCNACRRPYPCPTISILDEPARAARRDEEGLGDAKAHHFSAPLDYLNDARRDEEKR